MKSVLISLSLLVLAGCSAGGHDEKSTGHDKRTAASTVPSPAVDSAVAPVAMTASTIETEIGCGSCVFHIDGVTGCAVAAKVDGKAVLVKGGEVDPHSLCSGPVRARLTGSLEGPTFVATRVELLEAAATSPTATITAPNTAHQTSVIDVELGCGQCVYHMAGVTGCTVAAKVGDQILKVEGGNVDPHGLCAGPKKAKVDGYVADGKLVAANIELQ